MFAPRMRVVMMIVAIIGGALSPAAGDDFFVSTGGSDANSGSQAHPFGTLGKALDVAGPGDVVTLLPGVYRTGEIEIKQGGTKGKPVTIHGLPGAKTVLKGSKLVTGWKPSNKKRGLWYVNDWPVDSQQLFADGQPLQQIGVHNKFQTPGVIPRQPKPVLPPVGRGLSDVKPGTFFYDAKSKTLYCILPNGVNPNGHTMEASVKDWILRGGLTEGNYVTLRNLTFMHTNGSSHGGRDGLVRTGPRGWTIDNCTFTYGDMTGLKMHGEDHIIRNCRMVFNGQTGIGVNGSYAGRGRPRDRKPENILIEDCEISYNNYRNFDKFWHAGGIKLIPSVRGVTIRHCAFIDNHDSAAIWFDSDLGDNRIINNFIWGNFQGIQIEATQPAKGDEFSALIQGNCVISSTAQGIYLSGSSNAIVKNNTVYDNRWSVVLHGARKMSPPRAPRLLMHNRVVNNIIGGNHLDAVVYVGDYAADNILQGNFYVTTGASRGLKISITSKGYDAGRVYTDLDTLRRETEFGDHAAAGDPQWVAPGSGDFRLKPGSPARDKGSLGDASHPLKPSGKVNETPLGS